LFFSSAEMKSSRSLYAIRNVACHGFTMMESQAP
jgi:hypothetical protein